jgi:hypothetical protein
MNDFQLSAKYIASIIDSIFAKRSPSIWDTPHFGGDPFFHSGNLFKGLHGRPSAENAEINPQPLPPRLAHFSSQVDSVVGQIVELERFGSLLGGEVVRRTNEEASSILDDFDELCPRLPKWWKRHFGDPDTMDDTELFLFAMGLLTGSEAVRQEKTGNAMVALAQKMVSFSTQEASVAV